MLKHDLPAFNHPGGCSLRPHGGERLCMPEIHVWHWAGFGGVVALLLTLDLSLWHRRAREPSLREAVGWSAFWIALSLVFNAVLWRW